MVPKTASKSAETGTVTSDEGNASPYIAQPKMAKVLLPGRRGYTRIANNILDPSSLRGSRLKCTVDVGVPRWKNLCSKGGYGENGVGKGIARAQPRVSLSLDNFV